jgi:hypothetical protein
MLQSPCISLSFDWCELGRQDDNPGCALHRELFLLTSPPLIHVNWLPSSLGENIGIFRKYVIFQYSKWRLRLKMQKVLLRVRLWNTCEFHNHITLILALFFSHAKYNMCILSLGWRCVTQCAKFKCAIITLYVYITYMYTHMYICTYNVTIAHIYAYMCECAELRRLCYSLI